MRIISVFSNLISIYIKPFFRQIQIELKYSHVMFSGRNAITNVHFGSNVKIYEGTTIANSTVGAYTYIGGNCKLQNVNVGKFCSIGPNVRIGLGMHPTDLISTYPGFYSDKASGVYSFNVVEGGIEYQDVSIGNDVWIGDGAVIMDGLKIGNGVIVGARAVVTKDVPDFAIVLGMPAKIVRYRFPEEEIRVINSSKWWDWSHKQIEARAKYLADKDLFFKKTLNGFFK